MDWTAPVDAYCERLSPGLWAEPINAVTNLGFVLAALWLWPRVRGVPLARALCGILAAIGIGSGLFHTFAQPWAGLLDVAPILGFILVYVFAAHRDVWGQPAWLAAVCAALFVPYAALTAPIFGLIPGLGGSAAYAPVPLLIAGHAWALRARAPQLARGMALGAALLVLSITLRALDAPLCDVWPMGTHFGWHLLNAAMLGWMIWIYARHMLAGARPRG